MGSGALLHILPSRHFIRVMRRHDLMTIFDDTFWWQFLMTIYDTNTNIHKISYWWWFGVSRTPTLVEKILKNSNIYFISNRYYCLFAVQNWIKEVDFFLHFGETFRLFFEKEGGRWVFENIKGSGKRGEGAVWSKPLDMQVALKHW